VIRVRATAQSNRCLAVSNASAKMTGSKMNDEYVVTSESTSAAAAASVHPVACRVRPARTEQQAAADIRNKDIASKVASAPSCSVGPSSAHSPAAKKADLLPNSVLVVHQSIVVAPSIIIREKIRAAARPPRLSASAPSGG